MILDAQRTTHEQAGKLIFLQAGQFKYFAELAAKESRRGVSLAGATIPAQAELVIKNAPGAANRPKTSAGCLKALSVRFKNQPIQDDPPERIKHMASTDQIQIDTATGQVQYLH